MIVKADIHDRIKSLKSLEIGKKYFVQLGIWSGVLIYCGHIHSSRKHTFTFGNSVDDWKNNFNLVGYQKELYVWNLEDVQIK